MPRSRWLSAAFIPKKVRAELAERGIKVRRVRDADEAVVLGVTDSDIRRGRPKDPFSCALAECGKRQEQVDAAVIRQRSAYLIREGDAVRYSVPVTVRQELVAFDRGGKVFPGRYELRVPPASQRLGADARQKKKANGSRTRRTPAAVHVTPRHVTAGIRW